MFDGKKVMIFDLDGTLIDTLGMWNEIDREVIITAGGKPAVTIQEEREKFFLNNISGNIYVKYEQYLLKRYNIAMDLDDFHQLRWEISQNYLRTIVTFKPFALDFLNLLKQKNYILVLATTSTKATLDVYMRENSNIYDHINLFNFFDLVLTRDDVKLKKPHPEIYLKVLDLLNVCPNECLVFEDSLLGIQAAQTANIDVVNIYDKYDDKDQKQIKNLVKYPHKNYKELIESLNN